MKLSERQEGANELTPNTDTIKPLYIDSSVSNDNIVSHPSSLTDKSFQNISQATPAVRFNSEHVTEKARQNRPSSFKILCINSQKTI